MSQHDQQEVMVKRAGVAPALDEALAKRGYANLTPVQQPVLDPDLGERDLLVSAQTGSGKTVAYGLAMARTLLGEAAKFGRAEAPLALVVAPTRELALQVSRELDWLYKPAGVAIALSVGGMDPPTERRALDQGAHLVVGTPGRLRDHRPRYSRRDAPAGGGSRRGRRDARSRLSRRPRVQDPNSGLPLIEIAEDL